MLFSYHNGTILKISGVGTLDVIWEAFWEAFGEGFLRVLMSKVGFWGFEKESNFEAEVGSRKSGFRDVKGASAGQSSGPIIDR